MLGTLLGAQVPVPAAIAAASLVPRSLAFRQVLAAVSAQTEVLDLTLEEPAIEDIVRTLYSRGV